ncbi:MAG: TonB family protein [Myxococcota bacterium]|jgi:TonB family protein|nr:TonB family protein [Myxococcota bacterium]
MLSSLSTSRHDLLRLALLLCLCLASTSVWAQELSPPVLLDWMEPLYPELAEPPPTEELVVEYLVTVEPDGQVSQLELVQSAGAAFDQAAETALRQWRFEPARNSEGDAVPTKIRIPLIFAAPPDTEAPEPAEPPEATLTQPLADPTPAPVLPQLPLSAVPSQPEPSDEEEDWSDEDFLEVRVQGERRPHASSSAEYRVELGALRIVPRKNAAEQLMLAPGVLTTNHGGEGHANETYMRGFASKEGQDIEFTLDGVPLNDISNPHAHGYTDLHFIPPEFVRAVKIAEGPFDADQGDFAFAGSANYELGVDERGVRVGYGYGSWNSHRAFMLYAPADEHEDTFAGFELARSDGFGQNRASQRSSALARYAGVLANELTLRNSVYASASRYDQAGVLRQDDYRAGRVGFFDSYDPNQGGESDRLLLSTDLNAGSADSSFRILSWFGLRNMRLRTNFTGWLSDVSVNADGQRNVQRGDGLELRYEAMTLGSRGTHQTTTEFWSQPQTFALGYAVRYDRGESSQYRLRSVTAIPYSTLFDEAFNVLNIGGWARAQLRPFEWLSASLGLRVDTFSFGVDDLNQSESDREGARVDTQTSQAFGFAVNPRLSLDATLLEGLHLLASYGQGTRSADASALSDNETSPFALAQVVETGLSHELRLEELDATLRTQLSYVYTHVDKDMLFDPISGRTVFTATDSSSPVGPSTRHALLLSSRFLLGQLFDALLNVGYAYGTLDATGEQIPYIPELILRLDLAVNGALFDWSLGDVPVTGHAGLGFTYVPGRPLPYRGTGDDYYLLGLAAELRLWHVSLGVELRNLLDLEYRQAEFNYASNFRGPDALASQRPARHFAAGEPFFVMSTLTVHLDELWGGESPEP